MTLTPLEIDSIASSLAVWERVEYAAEALVLLGCAAEIVPPRISVVSDQTAEEIEKWGGYLLLAALILSLTALLKTNNLSGQIVDSFGDTAKHAASDAKIAEDLADGAKTAANSAKTTAGEANTLAKGAREEADSFASDIALAKEQAAAAEKDLVEALKEAAEARKELAKYREQRHLSEKQKLHLRSVLNSDGNLLVSVFMEPNTPETRGLAEDLIQSLKPKFPKISPSTADTLGFMTGEDTQPDVTVYTSEDDATYEIGKTISKELNEDGIIATPSRKNIGYGRPAILISIGTKK